MVTEYNYKNNAQKKTCFFWDVVFRHWVFIAQRFKTMQRPVHDLGLWNTEQWTPSDGAQHHRKMVFSAAPLQTPQKLLNSHLVMEIILPSQTSLKKWEILPHQILCLDFLQLISHSLHLFLKLCVLFYLMKSHPAEPDKPCLLEHIRNVRS